MAEASLEIRSKGMERAIRDLAASGGRTIASASRSALRLWASFAYRRTKAARSQDITAAMRAPLDRDYGGSWVNSRAAGIVANRYGAAGVRARFGSRAEFVEEVKREGARRRSAIGHHKSGYIPTFRALGGGRRTSKFQRPPGSVKAPPRDGRGRTRVEGRIENFAEGVTEDPTNRRALEDAQGPVLIKLQEFTAKNLQEAARKSGWRTK